MRRDRMAASGVSTAMYEDEKRAAAMAAVAEVEDGMMVGLGTGSTAAYAIEAIGARVREGLRIEAVATSIATERLANRQGIAVRDMAKIASLDLTIDGADEIDPRLFAVKGGGGAMVREKIVAAASRRMVVIADRSKLVERIGAAKLPVEVLAIAAGFVAVRLETLGATVTWREVDGARFHSDQGNPILDAHFADIDDPVTLGRELDALPGVVGHGLFLSEVVAAYIATGSSITTLERPTYRD